MKRRATCLLTALMLSTGAMWAQSFVNLTPKPESMTVADGRLTLPKGAKIYCDGIDQLMQQEVNKFVTDVNAATDLGLSADGDASALVHVSMLPTSSTLKDAGYTLNVTSSKVEIQAKTALGLFYAFQSVKKILPPNVMAGVKDASVVSYTMPLVNISDEPRFEYRGFMLDCSRHFFSVAEIKRMLDVMSYYKMNKFHWHLTDDQGWRAEIKKYPKLTTIGATAPNSRFTSLEEARAYWINKPYGPYYYTKEQMKDIVAYAAKLHIDIIPEVDMPGHFSAVMAAYPEFSCTPNGGHQVQVTGGIFNDVMNVANPKAMQFVYDVIDELTDIFPYKYFHIGGDECPTAAWQGNADCQKLYSDLKLTNYRQLQSWFISKVDSFVKTKGRRLSMWNESITESGADVDLVKKSEAPIYCWTGATAAVNKAHDLGLPSIFTTWGPYYINRKQGNGPKDPPGAANGSDHVMATYNEPIPANTDYGVQGTFWCEWVSDSTYMEWLALPRLIAIAEAGWTPQSLRTGKFDDFIQRAATDTTLLNYNNYRYCKYYMPGYQMDNSDKVMPHASTADKKYYYRIISGGTDGDRKDRCIELLGEGSPLISQNSGKGGAANRLWTNTQADSTASNYDRQWWSVELDPNGSGKYALVCKAEPDGSVNPNPTATNNTGRWTYDTSAKHYNFSLGTGAYGKKGDNYYYTIASDQVSGQYFNSSMTGQGLAVNVWSDPNGGGGGQWEFSPAGNYDTPQPTVVTDSVRLGQGKTYVFTNAVDGFDNTTIADNGTTGNLTASTDPFASNAWTVVSATNNADGTQTVTLQNAATNRYFGTLGSWADRLGYPVSMSNNTASVTLSPVSEFKDIRVAVGGKSVFPLPSGQVYAGANVEQNATYDAPRSQGAEWTAQEVRVVNFNCVEDNGNTLGAKKRSVPVSVTDITNDLCPTFKNLTVKSLTKNSDNDYTVTYERSAYTILYIGTNNGVIVTEKEDAAKVGQSYTVSLPAPKYFTMASSDKQNGSSYVPTKDDTIHVAYTTDAVLGVAKDGDPVTSLEEGKSYLIYDATPDAGRAGYRVVNASNRVNRVTSVEALTSNGIWTLEKSGNGYKVKNAGTELYVPQLVKSGATTASANGDTFVFTLNGDGTTWNVKGTNNLYWDGLQAGDLVGWDGGTGHPIRVSTFYGKPMFKVTYNCVSEAGTALETSEVLVDAGSEYVFDYPFISGYTFKSVAGAEGYAGTLENNLVLTATYMDAATGITTVTTDATKADNRIYDLSGRQVSKPGKGIYIRNGKKFIVR